VITWGRRSPRYAVKKRTLGNYQKKTNTIRINPILDNRKVPRYVIKYIVYHEMLHAVIDAVVKNGRRRIHSKEFKNRERKYRNYHQAIEWEKRNFRTYPIVQTLESII
jgi:predicted metal-dependent hydrolase